MFQRKLPSGKHTKNYGQSPFIVVFPIKYGDFPYFFVGLPDRVPRIFSDLTNQLSVPSGEHTKSNGKWPSRNSGFSH